MCELVKEQCEHLEHQDLVWKLDQVCAARVDGVWERGRVLHLQTTSGCLEVDSLIDRVTHVINSLLSGSQKSSI